jgi:hypothetical protein
MLEYLKLYNSTKTPNLLFSMKNPDLEQYGIDNERL